jgi:hypothetical protein
MNDSTFFASLHWLLAQKHKQDFNFGAQDSVELELLA